MNLYPEITDVVSESWQAKKWVSESVVDDDTPMWADWDNPAKSHRQYFVHELAMTQKGDVVLILKWLLVNGEMSVDVKDVRKEQVSKNRYLPHGTHGSFSAKHVQHQANPPSPHARVKSAVQHT